MREKNTCSASTQTNVGPMSGSLDRRAESCMKFLFSYFFSASTLFASRLFHCVTVIFIRFIYTTLPLSLPSHYICNAADRVQKKMHSKILLNESAEEKEEKKEEEDTEICLHHTLLHTCCCCRFDFYESERSSCTTSDKFL